MDMQLERLMKLVKKTGDRLIVLDPKSGDPFVLMGVDAYEKLIGMSTELPLGQKMSSIGEILREQTLGAGYEFEEKKFEEESEILPGLQTELVEIDKSEKEENKQNNQNYFFEEIEGGQEKEKNEDKLEK